MKKIARILALLLVVVMLCSVLVSCAGKPNEDPKEASDALKDAEYIVKLYEKGQAVVENAEYALQAVKMGDLDFLDMMTMDEEEIDEMMKEMEGETVVFDFIMVFYFKNEKDAEKSVDEVEELAEGFIDEEIGNWARLFEEEYEKYDITVEFEPGEVTLDGCMVYIGTPGALKDAA